MSLELNTDRFSLTFEHDSRIHGETASKITLADEYGGHGTFVADLKQVVEITMQEYELIDTYETNTGLMAEVGWENSLVRYIMMNAMDRIGRHYEFCSIDNDAQ